MSSGPRRPGTAAVVITTSNSEIRASSACCWRLHLLGRELAGVAALGLRAGDAEVEEVRAEALDLLFHRGADVEAGDDGAEAARGRDRLQAGDAGADHEHLRRRHVPAAVISIGKKRGRCSAPSSAAL